MTVDGHEPPRCPSPPAVRVGVVRWAVAAAVSIALAWTAALAFQPVLGTEFLLSDASGTTLVGYGMLHEDGLEIRLAHDAEELRVVVVGPDGTAETYVGTLRDGRLRIVSADGEELDVADALARDDHALRLAWPDEAAATVPPRAADGRDGGRDGAVAGRDEDEAGDEAGDDDGPPGPAAEGPEDERPGVGRPDDDAARPGRGPPDTPAGDAPGRGPPDTPPGRDDRPGAPGRGNVLYGPLPDLDAGAEGGTGGAGGTLGDLDWELP